MSKSKKFPILSRKDLLAAIELGIELENGQSIVHRPQHGKYEIRSKRGAHSVEIKWALPGHLWDPQGKDA
jgi:hypothetical protein